MYFQVVLYAHDCSCVCSSITLQAYLTSPCLEYHWYICGYSEEKQEEDSLCFSLFAFNLSLLPSFPLSSTPFLLLSLPPILSSSLPPSLPPSLPCLSPLLSVRWVLTYVGLEGTLLKSCALGGCSWEHSTPSHATITALAL